MQFIIYTQEWSVGQMLKYNGVKRNKLEQGVKYRVNWVKQRYRISGNRQKGAIFGAGNLHLAQEILYGNKSAVINL